MKAGPLRTGVVIVNYASSQYVRNLLGSLESEQVARVLVWDNFSTVAEVASVEALLAEFPNIVVEFSPENIGFGAGVNASVEILMAADDLDYVWLLNPDVVVRPGTLEKLLASAVAHDCTIISPLIISPRTGRIWYSGGRLDRRAGRSIHHRIGEPLGAHDVGFDYVNFVSGAAPLFRLSDWRSVGGFDERFFLYCEDAELSMRLEDALLRQGVERDAVVEHAEGASSSAAHGPSPTFYYYVQRNRLVLYSRETTKLGLLIGRGFGETMRLTILTMRPFGRGAMSRLSASFGGLLAGLAGRQGAR